MELVLVIAIICVIAMIVWIAVTVHNERNYYPNRTIEVNITGKRISDEEKFLNFYFENCNFNIITNHLDRIEQWKEEKINSFNGDENKIDKFRSVCHENCYKAFTIVGYRTQTRYKQQNYVRTPYKVDVEYFSINLSDDQMKDILKDLGREYIYVSNEQNISDDSVLSKKLGQWMYFFLDDNVKFNESVGKWMFFYSFDNMEFAENICKTAIMNGIVEECKYQYKQLEGDTSGVACFYINGDDAESHKNVIRFFIENNLIRKTKTGKYHNISFKFNSQTRNKEYGKDFKSEIKLSDFINLETGEWIK